MVFKIPSQVTDIQVLRYFTLSHRKFLQLVHVLHSEVVTAATTHRPAPGTSSFREPKLGVARTFRQGHRAHPQFMD